MPPLWPTLFYHPIHLLMKQLRMALLGFLMLATSSWAALTNESIIKMVEAGLEAETIISVIEKDAGDYDVSVDGLIALKSANVPESVIQAMIQAGEPTADDAAPATSSASSYEEDSGESTASVSIRIPPIGDVEVGGEYYTRFTFYYERGTYKSTNYRRGTPVPINTPARLVSVGSKEFVINVRGENIKVENIPEYTGVSTPEFAAKMLSPEPTPIDGYGKRMASDIRSGTLRLGMTKEQAILTRGYPPIHETPSLEGDRWVYWSSRFVKQTIVFYDGILSEGRGIN